MEQDLNSNVGSMREVEECSVWKKVARTKKVTSRHRQPVAVQSEESSATRSRQQVRKEKPLNKMTKGIAEKQTTHNDDDRRL